MNRGVRDIIKGAVMAGRPSLLYTEGRDILSSIGIAVPRGIFFNDPEELSRRLKGVSPPFILKAVSPHISHKTDVGGVIGGIEDVEGIRNAVKAMRKRLRINASRAEITGFIVEESIPAGYEAILGGFKDPQFGPVVMFGLGGIYVEIMKDVSYRLAPVTEREAQEMIRELRSCPILTGFRGSKNIEMSPFIEVIVNFSRFVDDAKEIKELEINPLIINNNGIFAADVRVMLS